MTDPRSDAIQAELAALLTQNPAGILSSEVRALMTAHGFSGHTSVEQIMAQCRLPIWDEPDDAEVGERWWRLCRPEDKPRRTAVRMKQPKKSAKRMVIRIDKEKNEVLKTEARKKGLRPSGLLDRILTDWMRRMG